MVELAQLPAGVGLAADALRGSLAPLLTAKADLQALARVQELLARERGDAGPNLVHGLLVRFKLAGGYLLRDVESLEVADTPQGSQILLIVQAPESVAAGAPTRRIPLQCVSGTDPLADGFWAEQGRGELAELITARGERGLPLSLAEAAIAVQRKQAALRWHGQHWSEAEQERRLQLPALLASLAGEVAPAQAPVQPSQLALPHHQQQQQNGLAMSPALQLPQHDVQEQQQPAGPPETWWQLTGSTRRSALQQPRRGRPACQWAAALQRALGS
ncbi:hypothetical protein ABPG75_000415 [Micractinium tetrahymenae]